MKNKNKLKRKFKENSGSILIIGIISMIGLAAHINLFFLDTPAIAEIYVPRVEKATTTAEIATTTALCDLDAVICPDERRGVIREITAYNSVESQTDGSPCIGAGGEICTRYQKGECIVAANAYPLGTKLKIQNIGICTVADRMNARYQNRIDIFMDKDIERARKFGVQHLEVVKL